MFAGLSKYILLVLLLLGQSSLLAHELDLDAHQSNDSCEVCLLHSALDDAPVSSTSTLLFAAHHSHAFTSLTSALTNRASRHFQSRAPPIPTFV